MIDENMKVWLIEVNSSPSFDKSNSVLEKLIKELSDDYLKVILDGERKDKGKFKLVY